MEEFRKMRKLNPGYNAGLLVLFAMLLFGLTGSNALAMDRQAAENPLYDYQGLGKTTVLDEVVCNVGMVENLISNTTSEKATGTNDWTILIGDDSNSDPSMVWKQPAIYADNNHYLYFASLRLGYNGHIIRLAQDVATNITVGDAVSTFDTDFHIADTSVYVDEQYRENVAVRQQTYAWSEAYRDDFIN